MLVGRKPAQFRLCKFLNIVTNRAYLYTFADGFQHVRNYGVIPEISEPRRKLRAVDWTGEKQRRACIDNRIITSLHYACITCIQPYNTATL